MDSKQKGEQFRAWIKSHPLFSMDDVPTGWAAQISTIAIHYAEHAVTNKQAHDTMLSGLNVSNGEAILSLEGGACRLLADAFANQFTGSGATNYLEMQMHSEATGPMTITMQRVAGKTPGQRIAELEQLVNETS